MFSLRFLFFVALAVACVFAAEEAERTKKDVLLGTYPYAYSGIHSAAYVPTTYGAYGAYPYAAYPYNTGLYRSIYY